MARILLIEDSPTEAAVMIQLLERNGHQGLNRDSSGNGSCLMGSMEPRVTG
ncbi:hypothetical protein SAMN02745204_01983 [Thermomonas hydrothermalis]|uniref:Response regulatory domain-containing protein n=1 Tax=Thermomonas hydrothermalis TaxID=213588 RepID=A0A1M4ZMT3_9GAMM|nr:hypothetical protein SAMN02745204_01983 [Thermomonas hydrothermalis]